jgi:hypothetical protein
LNHHGKGQKAKVKRNWTPADQTRVMMETIMLFLQNIVINLMKIIKFAQMELGI